MLFRVSMDSATTPFFEATVNSTVAVTGVGLHSGAKASMRIGPGPAGSGIVFLRSDLNGFQLRANWKHVAKVSYATSLMRQGVLLSTTEHLLSVLYALGIDNARIEIDNLEVPILDGSGRPFVEIIEAAGRREQKRPRRYLAVKKTVEVRDGAKRVAIEPSDRLELVCETFFQHPTVGAQRWEGVMTPEVYAREIAAARTFGFEQDLEQLRTMGLIRGATLDNAICFGPDGPLNEGGLRFTDECCRHKALDLLGDLAMIGRPLLGRIVAERAGHAMHIALVRKIMSDPDCYSLVEGPREAVAV